MDTLVCQRYRSAEIKITKHISVVSAKYVYFEEKYDCHNYNYICPSPEADKLDLMILRSI